MLECMILLSLGGGGRKGQKRGLRLLPNPWRIRTGKKDGLLPAFISIL